MPSKTKKSTSKSKSKSRKKTNSPRTRSRRSLSAMTKTPSFEKLSDETYLDEQIKKYERRIRECNKAITVKGELFQSSLYPVQRLQFSSAVDEIMQQENSPAN